MNIGKQNIDETHLILFEQFAMAAHPPNMTLLDIELRKLSLQTQIKAEIDQIGEQLNDPNELNNRKTKLKQLNK